MTQTLETPAATSSPSPLVPLAPVLRPFHSTLLIGECFNFGHRSLDVARDMQDRITDKWALFTDEHLRVLLFWGAFWGDVRLRDSCGLTDYDSLNLCWPGPVGAWDREHAKRVADLVRERIWDRYRVVILCGKRVAAAFDYDHLPQPSMWQVGEATRMLVIPHPSGQCRVWNDPSVGERVKELYANARVD